MNDKALKIADVIVKLKEYHISVEEVISRDCNHYGRKGIRISSTNGYLDSCSLALRIRRFFEEIELLYN